MFLPEILQVANLRLVALSGAGGVVLIVPFPAIFPVACFWPNCQVHLSKPVYSGQLSQSFGAKYEVPTGFLGHFKVMGTELLSIFMPINVYT